MLEIPISKINIQIKAWASQADLIAGLALSRRLKSNPPETLVTTMTL